MNKVELIGRLTKDIELRTTNNNISCAQFTLAVDRRFKDANGQRQADFINCVAWRQNAEFLSKYFCKGMKCAVCGSIQTRNYEKNGEKVYVTEVVVDETYFVESKLPEGNGSSQPPKADTKPVAPSIDDSDPLAGMPFQF